MSLTSYELVFHAQIFADKSYLMGFSCLFQQAASFRKAHGQSAALVEGQKQSLVGHERVFSNS